MDQYLSTVVIALITGIFSVITLVIQKKQDKVIDKIDEQTLFIEREKCLKQKLAQKEKEREQIIHEIMILILDTNLHILKNSSTTIGPEIDGALNQSDELQNKYKEVNEDIESINKEYEVVLAMTEEFQEELERIQNSNKE